MPSTVVHVAVAGLIGVALLGKYFDTRAIVVVMAVTALIDLDTLLGIYISGGHRAIGHNLFVVLLPTLVLLWDVKLREESYVLERWGRYGYRVAWVSLFALLFAHVLLDAFYNGVNLFWPLYDRFLDLSGDLYISDQEGFVQTFVEIESGEDGTTTVDEDTDRGGTDDTHYRTGFDPGDDVPEDHERKFWLAERGELFVISVAGYLTVLGRIAMEYRGDEE